jgi:hypothetical protein
MSFINPEFLENLKMIGILWITVVGYILSGTATHCLTGKHEHFSWNKFLTGIAKSIVACVSLILIAYILTIIDLSALGFDSNTIINAGVLIYAAKMLSNAMYLLGISKDGKESNEAGSILTSMDDILEDEEEETPVAVGEAAPADEAVSEEVVEEPDEETVVEEPTVEEVVEDEEVPEDVLVDDDFEHVDLMDDYDNSSDADSEEAVG